MAAATVEMENKELKKQTEDIEEMISLLKQLTSGEKREVKGIMIGLQMAKQAGLTAWNMEKSCTRNLGQYIMHSLNRKHWQRFSRKTCVVWDLAIETSRS